jgi:hypothetical protein
MSHDPAEFQLASEPAVKPSQKDGPGALALAPCWASGNVRLYLGDSLEIAPTLTGIDAVISDPPYGMDWNTDSTRFTQGMHKPGDGRADWGNIEEDAQPFNPATWLAFPRCVLWGANHYAARLPLGTTLVWLKKADHLFGTFLSDAELGWMKGGYGVYAFRKQFPPPSRMAEHDGTVAHPTQKPIALMAWCMDKAKVPVGATVLDPYMGSGTTGIACIRTGRGFVGIEKDPAHYATALERIQRELAQGDLFLGLPNTHAETGPRQDAASKRPIA